VVSESPQQPDPRDASVSAGDQAGDQDGKPDTPPSLTFRITPISLLGVVALVVCVTPLAWAHPWLLSAYLIPVLVVVWILRVRTVVGASKVTARTMFGRSDFAWDEVTSFRLDERRWLRAVLGSGKEVRLPAVRVRDLPRLAAMSGGRLPDPTASDAAVSDAAEPDAAGPDTTEPGTAEPDTAEQTATPHATPSDVTESTEITEDDSSRTQ
jgi:hypothetical protein